MRRFVDLHTHSTASDGQTPPRELILLADRLGLAAIALTDHDTTAGLAEARNTAKDTPDLTFIPGIEVSAQCERGTMHILGLGIDEAAPEMREFADRLRRARDERNPKIIENLRGLGIEVCLADVQSVAEERREGHGSAIISRVHMAEALRRKGVVADLTEAFERYIGSDAPAYVQKQRPGQSEAIAVIRGCGGQAVLAHPSQLKCENSAQLERIVRHLMSAGLAGIEVYHTDHTPEQTRSYLDLARRFELGIAGGSDFHGRPARDTELGKPRVPLGALTGEIARLSGRR